MIRFNRQFAAILVAAAALGTTAIATGTEAVAREVRDHRSKPEVRDHRTQPEVRDHRTQPTVRDHRNSRTDVSNSPGGVRVTPGASRCRAQVCATGNERPGRGRWQP
jgi:hypothetical protein